MKTLVQTSALIVLLATLTACNDTEFSSASKKPAAATLDASKAVTETFTSEELKKAPVDIVFAIDASGSMRAEQERLRANLNSFISSFVSSSAGLDYQIFVIDPSFTVPAGNAKIAKVNRQIGSWDALDVLAAFLGGSLSSTLTRRNDAALEAIVISDDNAGKRNGMSAATFRNILTTKYPALKFHFHGLVGLPTSANNTWCNIVEAGREYSTLGADSTYGGLILDLCTENWGELLTKLGNQIGTANASQKFVLKAKPDMTKERKVYMNDRLLKESDYQIDSATNELTFSSGVLVPNASIKVVYTSR